MFTLALCCAVLLCSIPHSYGAESELTIRMNSRATADEQYLCISVSVEAAEKYIVAYTPLADKNIAHHMLLYGCEHKGIDAPVWNCGHESESSQVNTDFPRGQPCGGQQKFFYAWALNADGLKLPEGVGFHVGGASPIKHYVLQVHYTKPTDVVDDSGVTLHFTDEKLTKFAGVLQMGSLQGTILSQKTDNFDIVCPWNRFSSLHPFAFRTHTHGLGLVVSGYRVRSGEWDVIGKMNPQRPQMFYPVFNESLAIEYGDILAARCHMHNYRDHDVSIGYSFDVGRAPHFLNQFFVLYVEYLKKYPNI